MRVGVLGIGFMGWIHYLAYQRASGAEMVAFASSDEKKRAGDWRGIQGNFGPAGEQIDVTGMRAYGTLEELLADPEIDLIDVCTPPYDHVASVTAALRAGKHVLCEKPLALSAEEALGLVEEAENADRKLLVGHMLPFNPEFDFLVTAARDQRYGAIRSGHFRRIIGPPDWNPDFYKLDRVGGSAVDLHVHDAHLIRLLFGMPSAVTSRGRMRGEGPQYFETLLDFEADDRFASVAAGVIDSNARPFCHGFEVHFEQAVVQFEAAALADGAETMPLKVLHNDGRIERPDLGSGDPVDAFVAEMQAAAGVIDQGANEPILDGRTAAEALQICHAQIEAVRSRETVQLGAPA